MAATGDIIATYRGPAKVMRRILARGQHEESALIYLMIGCLMVFVAQTPRLAREAFETDANLSMLLGGTLMAWLFIMPLVLYALGALTHLVAKALGSKVTSFGARMALFWALLASSPLILLWGLTAGFVGPGPQMTAVGAIWFALFIWFWVSGFLAAHKGES